MFQIHFVGGPNSDRSATIPELFPQLNVNLDDTLRPTSGQPAAFAVYAYSHSDRYEFAGISAQSGASLDIEFVGGPLNGIEKRPFFPAFVKVALNTDASKYDGDGEVAGVAEYELTCDSSLQRMCFYSLVQINKSKDATQEAREAFEEHVMSQAMGQFYLHPDYGIYSKQPTDLHKQVLVQVGKRRAHVDEKLAKLIEALWKSGFDTIGSCQERPKSYENPERAYVGFLRVSQAEEFRNALAKGKLSCEIKYVSTTFAKRNPDGSRAKPIELRGANVLFATADIDLAAAAFENRKER